MNKIEEIKRTSSLALNRNGKLLSISEQYEIFKKGESKHHDLIILRENSHGFNYFEIKEDLLLVIRKSTIDKICRKPTKTRHGHGDQINIKIIEEIFESANKIVYVIKNKYNNYAFIFDIKGKDNNYILVAMNPSKDIGRGYEVNDITSIYCKNNLKEYLEYCKNNKFIIKKVNARNLEYDS